MNTILSIEEEAGHEPDWGRGSAASSSTCPSEVCNLQHMRETEASKANAVHGPRLSHQVPAMWDILLIYAVLNWIEFDISKHTSKCTVAVELCVSRHWGQAKIKEWRRGRRCCETKELASLKKEPPGKKKSHHQNWTAPREDLWQSRDSVPEVGVRSIF